jgi:hypothetical protein
MTRVLNWVRRVFGALERRWIPDSLERSRHQALVRHRLRPEGEETARLD